MPGLRCDICHNHPSSQCRPCEIAQQKLQESMERLRIICGKQRQLRVPRVRPQRCECKLLSKQRAGWYVGLSTALLLCEDSIAFGRSWQTCSQEGSSKLWYLCLQPRFQDLGPSVVLPKPSWDMFKPRKESYIQAARVNLSSFFLHVLLISLLYHEK